MKEVNTYKKIGILTFHKAINTGAALQASSLLCYIRDQGYDAEIIDFIPNNEILTHSSIYNFFRCIKHLLFYRSYRIYREKINNFTLFYKNNYRLSKTTYYGDEEMVSAKGAYDLLLSGSDQVFNTNLTGNSHSYYLTFDNNAIKVSYASSLGKTDISNEEIKLIKEELPKFLDVSFREKTACDLVKRITGIEGEVVLDPVFLIDRSRWELKCNEHLKTPEKYVLIYAMEDSIGFNNMIDQIKRKYNLPSILINGSGIKIHIQGIEDKTFGPSEFLRYFRDAQLVLTNSFHGTAFSLIFNKKFICVEHSKRNTRLENLLTYVGMEKRQVPFNCKKNIELEKVIINAALVKYKLNPMIKKSKEYLKKALGEIDKK